MLTYICLATTHTRPEASISIEGQKYTALFDTGSTLTLLSWKTFLQLKAKGLVLEPSKTTLSSATGDSLRVKGELDVSLMLGKHTCIRPAVVVEGLRVSCIIGNDTLTSEGIILDPARQRLIIRPPKTKAEVIVKSKCTVAPYSDHLVACVFSRPFHSCDAVIVSDGPDKERELGITVVDSVQRTWDDQVSCVVTNNGPYPVKLERGVCIASALSVGAVKQTRLSDVSRPEPSKFSIKENDVDLSNVPVEWKDQFLALVRSYSDIFSLNPDDIGAANVYPHRIVLKNPNSVSSIPAYRLPAHLKHLADDYVDKLLTAGIIRASTSPFSSPLMLVKKPKASPDQPLVEQYRVVHDYRRVNQLIEMDSYPLRNIYELIDSVASGKIWTVADLSSGFWNQLLTEDSKHITAFGVQGKGHYEYNRTPQGLASSPPAFQRLLDYIILGLKNVYCYIDDVIVSSNTYEAHLKDLAGLFARFRKYRLKLRLGKLQIAKRDITYLGYHISQTKGVRAGEAKIASLKNWPAPTSVSDVRQFIGLCSFFRRTIPNFASIAAPLTKLTRKDSGYRDGPLPRDETQAFEKLKDLLCQRPCLRPVDFDQQFILTVDASTTNGLGAMLSQSHGGVEHPCAYASRVLSTAESNYSSYMLEMAAILFGARHFRPYLVGKAFVIRTDHKPLTGLNRIQGQQLERMRMELADFQPYTIEYIPGEKNPSDGLSRHPFLDQHGLAECAGVASTYSGYAWESLYEMQKEDNLLKAMACVLKYDSWPKDPSLLAFCKQHAANSALHHGVVCRRASTPGLTDWQVWVPDCMKRQLLQGAHDHPFAGHFGAEKTLSMLRAEWWWPRMASEVTSYTRQCVVCQKGNPPSSLKPSPLEPLPPALYFNHRVHCDLLGRLPAAGSDSAVYLMVVTDAFSHLCRLIPLPNKTADVVAKCFLSGWVASHGVPTALVTDRGKEFDAAVFAAMCSKLEIKHRFSSAGHPQSNAPVERMNRTILTYFRKYLETNEQWVSLLPGLEFAYNTSPHASTRLSPFVAAYGRRPSVPTSLRVPEAFYGSEAGLQSVRAMAEMHTTVVDLQHVAFAAQKAAYDRRSEVRLLSEGDVVYVTAPHTGTRFQKFQAPFMGPFTVQRVLGHNNYELWSPLRRSVLKCHINRIKLPSYTRQLGWEEDPPDNDATDNPSTVNWHDSLENTLREENPEIYEDDEPTSRTIPNAEAVAPPVVPPLPEMQRVTTRAHAAKTGLHPAVQAQVMQRPIERKERGDKGKERRKPPE